ncbi:ion channel [Polynucleobacter necessarius]|uniref:ion channel n=1 Tax=Polynucleobacter necessarius TaxID=576610 RepID=UPI000E0976C8|nr:ion channel [Polynucleobacter necessarius]
MAFSNLLERLPGLNSLPSISNLFSEVNTDVGNSELENKRVYGANFLSYFIVILLIVGIHLLEIIAWTYICIGLQVFPTNLQTLYFAGEMYTTVGFGDYTLIERWKIIPIITSFSGIFAVSLSGAALYTMMGALLGKPQNPKSGSGF